MAISPSELHLCLDRDLRGQNIHLAMDVLPWLSTKEAFAASLKMSLTKKLVSNVSPDADERALSKFLAVNERCGEWTLPDMDFRDHEIMQLFKSELRDFWEQRTIVDDKVVKCPLIDHPYDVLEKARLGSGSNVGAGGTSFYAKLFSSTLVASDRHLVFWYKRYIQGFPEWANAENIRQANYGSPIISPNSRLGFVPKNDEISRTICTEPALNTFYQLGFAQILERRLQMRYGISLSTQPFINRNLARLGSITDGLSTIDLSSASDSMSLNMLRYVLPSDFFRWLCIYRTPFCDIKGRGRIGLNMVSTMGNGFTFPLQTMLFSCVVAACFRFRGITPDRGESDRLFGVFGDDIICPSLVTGDVIRFLGHLGFQINSDKSFVEGPFRESCGADFFNGVNIRGVYIKNVNDEAALYSSINALIRYEARSGIRLPSLIGCLISELKKHRKKPLLVPAHTDPSCGIHVPYRYRYKTASNRFQNCTYYRLEPTAKHYTFGDGYVSCPRGSKRLIYNPSGLLISFLIGEVTSGRIAVRSDSVRWRPKRRYEASWSCNVTSREDRSDFALDWQRWDTAAAYYAETHVDCS